MLKNKRFKLLVFLGLTVFYLSLHLPSLTLLPVFADESIYIRWAQLIIDDWQRFLFFAMNDGKTPLFIWLLVPFQFVFKNQLFAGRFVSLLVGLMQIFSSMKIIKELGGKRRTQMFTGILISILPFWYFHHRMALMDGLLTLFISFAFLNLIKLSKKVNTSVFDNKKLILFAGISFGLAMLTKIPAILFIPSFYLTIFLHCKKDLNVLFKSFIKVSFAIFIGLLMFAFLKMNPVFGQLFSRGGDFLFPISEILTGKWKDTIGNIPNYINYFFTYLTPGAMILSIAGLFLNHNKKITKVLFWSGILFILPIALMGKTVYPRYLFPASLFFTLSAAMGLEGLIIGSLEKTNKIWKKAMVGTVVALSISSIITSSLNYIIFSMSDPNKIPFVASDVTQYLTEWSSGHGITETIGLIKNETSTRTLAVATEGYFGTLPDALLLYLHRSNVDNLYLEGIGQPVDRIPESFAKRATEFDKKWLVVNSHRMNMKIDKKNLIAEYCRPFNGPCLQVWDLTGNFNDYVNLP